jgi:cobalt/nickel transport system permease protein
MILGGGPHDSALARVDPRARLLLAAAMAGCVISMHSFAMLACALTLGFFLAAAAYGTDLPWRRFMVLNALMLGLLTALPWGVDGQPLFHLGALRYSSEGVVAVLRIALRANAIVLALTALVGTIEPVTLGHALATLRLPPKFAQLFLLTVRYIDVLETEYRQLRRAMTVRAFEPRFDRHTLHTFGNLVGMLLVRAVERSERIHDAMRCRAFNGLYPTLYEFRWTGRDAAFTAIVAAALGVLLAGERWAGLL